MSNQTLPPVVEMFTRSDGEILNNFLEEVDPIHGEVYECGRPSFSFGAISENHFVWYNNKWNIVIH